MLGLHHGPQPLTHYQHHSQHSQSNLTSCITNTYPRQVIMECDTPIVNVSEFHKLTKFVTPCDYVREVINYTLDTKIPSAMSLLSYLIIIHKLVIRACGKAILGQHFGEEVLTKHNYFRLALRHCVFTDKPEEEVYQCNACLFISTKPDHYNLHITQGQFAAGHMLAQKALTDAMTVQAILYGVFHLGQDARCTHCDQVYAMDDYETLLHHAINHHGHLLVPMHITSTYTADDALIFAARERLSQRPADATGAFCTSCGTLFPTLAALQLHQEHRGHGESIFICTICTDLYR